jgi:hypothetical protein
MKRISFGDRLTPYLLLASALLAVVVALEWRYAAQPEIDTRSQAGQLPDDAVALTRLTYTAPSIKAFDEILERPLFSEGRQPPPEPEASVTAPVVQTPLIRLRLEGVAITPESRVVVVRDLSNNQLLQLGEGMSHQGWTVESVQGNGATFARGEQKLELTLDPDNGMRGKR